MAPDGARILELREYEPFLCGSDEIPAEASERLWQEYGAKIDVEFPSPRTGGRYRITPLGWVGQIPLSPNLHLALLPKIPLANVPTHHVGDRAMVPFLVDMASLYELFVAEWLRTHLDSRFALRTQEKINITTEGTVRFSIDLVLYDAVTAEALCVLDTKYKAATQPDNADIFQVNTYAAAKQCKEAVLIYPQQLEQPFDTKIGDVRIRGLVFALDSDLEEAGKEILASLP